MPEEFDNKPLSRTEATLAADFLQRKKKELQSGWITIWKKRPSEISKDYKIPVEDILQAIRREGVTA